jgi:probable F420-dependent oxidoreductase
MRIGVVFPQTEIGADRGGVRSYAEAVAGLGFTHILSYDHVLGADRSVHEGFSGPYDLQTTFHEPFVLYGYLAAITSLELVCGIIILPQRQTALVAKQAAEVDLLTEGNFRLGVGIGWNAVEYGALDKDFTNRGVRLAEQVELLRRLWTEESVTFNGRYETVTGAGLAPRPIQQPIPIWFGANSPAAWRRTGRLADGWFPQLMPGKGFEEALEIVNDAAIEAGRDPAAIKMEGRVSVDPGDPDAVANGLEAWERVGASHISINTMRAGFNTVDEHIAALTAIARDLLPAHQVKMPETGTIDGDE